MSTTTAIRFFTIFLIAGLLKSSSTSAPLCCDSNLKPIYDNAKNQLVIASIAYHRISELHFICQHMALRRVFLQSTELSNTEAGAIMNSTMDSLHHIWVG